MSETRVCTKCCERHPVAFFNKDRSRPDGLYPQCKNCSRSACKRVYRKYEDRHKAIKRRWKAENPEHNREMNREWRQNNKDTVNRASRLRYQREKQATPPWVNKAVLDFTYDMRPPGYHVDHIHPLVGKDFCGLNVPWNLQFLPEDEHRKKGQKLLDKGVVTNL